MVLGLLIGSFLNVCIYRIPRSENIALPRSHCPSCQHTIAFYDLVPLISFIVLLGKCRYCKEPISFLYPLVEILAAAGTLFFYIHFSLTPLFFISITLFYSLIVITFIDLKHYIIPDIITLPGIGVGLALSFFNISSSFQHSLIGILMGGGILWFMGWIYQLLTKREGMGGGDIKLMARLGAGLGYKASSCSLCVSSGLGAIGGHIFILVMRKTKHTPIPFGPFIAAAALLYLLYGQKLTEWYFENLL